MFWGITLESGKKYTQVLQRSFCVTMAALGFENPSNDVVYVVAEVNNEHQQQQQHVLCSLQAGKVPQQTLNLSFTEGEHVSFFIEGEGQVHLTGYLTLEDDETDLSDSEDSDDGQKGTIEGNGVPTANQGTRSGNNVSNISWQGMLSDGQERIVSVNHEQTGEVLRDVVNTDCDDHISEGDSDGQLSPLHNDEDSKSSLFEDNDSNESNSNMQANLNSPDDSGPTEVVGDKPPKKRRQDTDDNATIAKTSRGKVEDTTGKTKFVRKARNSNCVTADIAKTKNGVRVSTLSKKESVPIRKGQGKS